MSGGTNWFELQSRREGSERFPCSVWSKLQPWAVSSPTDLKADEKSLCTLPDAAGSAPQEIDPSKENQLLFSYSVHWEVRGDWGTGGQLVPQVSVTEDLWKVLVTCWCDKNLLFFQESDIKWASRWDTYLTMSDVQIHWFSIINSVVVVFFLSGE